MLGCYHELFWTCNSYFFANGHSFFFFLHVTEHPTLQPVSKGEIFLIVMAHEEP